MDCIRFGVRNGVLLADNLGNKNTCNSSYHPRNTYLLQKVGEIMKVILIKSPKLLAPILRSIFKVKKINYED